MSATELKKKIIEEISSMTDESVLTEIYSILQFERNSEYKLSEEEISAVREGIEDVRQGRVFSSQEANSLIKEWLKK